MACLLCGSRSLVSTLQALTEPAELSKLGILSWDIGNVSWLPTHLSQERASSSSHSVAVLPTATLFLTGRLILYWEVMVFFFCVVVLPSHPLPQVHAVLTKVRRGRQMPG